MNYIMRLRTLFAFLVSLLLLAGSAKAQEAKLQITGLEKLAAKAAESVDINMDGSMLQLAAKFFSDQKPDEARIKQLIAGLKGIYVRSFEFDKEGEYSLEDVNAIRQQTRAPGWSKLVGVRSKRDKEDVEVFARMEGDKVIGLAIIAAEPKQLTVVNIVGPIDLEKLSDLEGQFGIPKMGLKEQPPQGTKKGKE
jgi:hypothetical protein